MNFEIGKTINAVIGDATVCTLHYTPEFVEYDEHVDGLYDDLETFETGILNGLENLVREEKIKDDIVATAYIDDEDSYLYVNTTDTIYMLSVLPIGIEEKYRVGLVAKVY